MAGATFSQLVSNLRTMASGITTRLTDLVGVNVVAADAATMEAFANELDRINSEQEELKSQLKAKTKELNAKMKEARVKHSDLSKRVKLATAQVDWTAFGIAAKR